MRLTRTSKSVSLVLLTTALVAGCSDSGSMSGNANMGRVRVVLGGGSAQPATAGFGTVNALTDGDGRPIAAASIDLSSILARNLEGELIDLTVDLPFNVDLIALIQGRTVELPIGSLPAGSYDQLVIVIRTLHVELDNGTLIDITPPGGGWTVVVRTEGFDVIEGQVTTVNLRFRAAGAFRWINGELDFNPGFDCEDVDDGDEDDD